MTDQLLDQGGADSSLVAAIVLDELAALGVSDLVCCPGSRSAPLAYAAANLDSQGRLRLHVRLDERSAGYFALGIAKATGRAVVVVTTSGTAAANLAPAIAEARYGRVPLIALTADRPATLVGTGANQTADQAGIFGNLPLAVIRLAATDRAPDAWRAAIRRAVVTAEGQFSQRGGAVHLNLELTPPLLGLAEPSPSGGPFSLDPPEPTRLARLDPGLRTVIVAGDLPPGVGRAWGEEANRVQIPLLAEPSSNARFGSAAIAGYRHLLPGFSPQIERVVLVGHPTLSRQVTALLSRPDIEIIAVDRSGEWPDPGWAVSRVVPGLRLTIGEPGWLARWAKADAALRERITRETTWSGERVAATVLASLTPGCRLVLGASNPIRDADLAPIPAASPLVYANRGLAGIDGTIATACGIARSPGERVVALIGDLTALHDIGSLALPVGEPAPDLTIVVADDRGGSLFASLEYGQARSQIGDLADWFERLFAVEMNLDLAAVCAGFGIAVTKVADEDQLRAALVEKTPGLRVVQAILDRDRRAERERLLATWGREAVRLAGRA